MGNNQSGLDCITKTIFDCNRIGDNSCIYIDKEHSDIVRDRVALSLIAGTLSSEAEFTSTMLRFSNTLNGQVEEYQSSIPLTYEAAMAFIYIKRMEGCAINDITYLCEDRISGSSFISIENLNSDSDIIKISISDYLIPMIESLIESNEHRNQEKHRTNILTLVNMRGSSLQFQEILELGFSKTFGIQGRCTINALSNSGRVYKVVYSNNIGGVIRGNRITLVALDNEKHALQLQSNIQESISNEFDNLDIKCTDDIIMF